MLLTPLATLQLVFTMLSGRTDGQANYAGPSVLRVKEISVCNSENAQNMSQHDIIN
jgi:hypothetical protein